MGARFKNEPIVIVHRDGGFSLGEQLEYYSMIVGMWIKVPKGERTDFASVPWYVRWIIPKVGKYNLATIIHDYLYQHAKFNKKIADRVFREAMKVLGVGRVRRNLMYAAVRIGGKGQY